MSSARSLRCDICTKKARKGMRVGGRKKKKTIPKQGNKERKLKQKETKVPGVCKGLNCTDCNHRKTVGMDGRDEKIK